MLFESLRTAFSSFFKGSTGKNIIYSIKKDVILSDITGEIDVIKTILIPMAEDFNTSLEGKVIDANDLSKCKFANMVIKSKSGIKSSTTFFRDYLTLFQNFVDNESKILDAISKALPNKVVTDSTVTARELAVLNFSQTLGMFVNFTLDVFLSISYELRGGMSINKKYLQGMEQSARAYLLVLGDFCGMDIVKHVSEFAKIDGVVIGQALKDAETGQSDTAKVLADNINEKNFSSLNREHGWIGNPIYHIRLYLNDREEAKIKKYKAYKAETELTLQDLRQRKEGVNDPSLDRQIEYYQNLIEDYNYKISRYEDTL